MLMRIMRDAREGKRFVMALSWVYCSCLSRYTSKTWYQELKLKNADYFTAIGLVTFCDIVWSLSLWLCMESRRNTECSCSFAPRPDGVFIFFTSVFFLNIKYLQIHWNFVSAVTTCEKFLCCYCKTCRCQSAGPVQNPAVFHNANILNFKRPNFDSRRKENRLESLRTFKRNVVTSSKEVLWIDFERKKMYSGTRLVRSWRPKDLRQLRLVWTGEDDVLRLQTDVRDEVGESGNSRM